MKIITQKTRARDAAMAWYRHYSCMPENRKPSITGRVWEKIYDELRAMDNPSPEDVNRVTASNHWTEVRCDACSFSVIAAAEFEASEWPIYICHDCLVSAANEIIMEITE